MTSSPAELVPVPVPNLLTNNTNKARDSQKRKKKKLLKHIDGKNNNQSNRNSISNDYESTEWKSEQQQEAYRSKLLKALRQLRHSSVTSTGRTVRETADRVLAVTAKGRSRWSRAILTNKLKLRFMMSNRRQRNLVVTATGNSRLKKPRLRILKLKPKKVLVVKQKSLPDVQRRARVLGGLVPGCQKQSLPVVLKEATDYIPALEMQVKAMAALVELLSGGSGSSSGSGAGTGNLGQLGSSRPPPCL